VRVIAEPEPRMPPVAQMRGGIGSVVLRLTVDGAGNLADVDIAASVGGPAFVESIMSVAKQWRVAKLDSSPPGCRMAQQRFQGVEYAYR
jgi:TonB family protein